MQSNNTPTPKPTKFTPRTVKDVPTVRHWVIIDQNSTMERGRDEKDPDERVDYLGYNVYLDKAEWQAAVVKRTEEKLNGSRYSSTPDIFLALEVIPAIIETKIAVSVDLNT